MGFFALESDIYEEFTEGNHVNAMERVKMFIRYYIYRDICSVLVEEPIVSQEFTNHWLFLIALIANTNYPPESCGLSTSIVQSQQQGLWHLLPGVWIT